MAGFASLRKRIVIAVGVAVAVLLVAAVIIGAQFWGAIVHPMLSAASDLKRGGRLYAQIPVGNVDGRPIEFDVSRASQCRTLMLSLVTECANFESQWEIAQGAASKTSFAATARTAGIESRLARLAYAFAEEARSSGMSQAEISHCAIGVHDGIRRLKDSDAGIGARWHQAHQETASPIPPSGIADFLRLTEKRQSFESSEARDQRVDDMLLEASRRDPSEVVELLRVVEMLPIADALLRQTLESGVAPGTH